MVHHQLMVIASLQGGGVQADLAELRNMIGEICSLIWFVQLFEGDLWT
jgi:hypothetical protein